MTRPSALTAAWMPATLRGRPAASGASWWGKTTLSRNGTTGSRWTCAAAGSVASASSVMARAYPGLVNSTPPAGWGVRHRPIALEGVAVVRACGRVFDLEAGLERRAEAGRAPVRRGDKAGAVDDQPLGRAARRQGERQTGERLHNA